MVAAFEPLKLCKVMFLMREKVLRIVVTLPNLILRSKEFQDQILCKQ